MSSRRRLFTGFFVLFGLVVPPDANAGIFQEGWHNALSVAGSTAEIVTRQVQSASEWVFSLPGSSGTSAVGASDGASQASISSSAARATTFEIAKFCSNTVIFSIGASSVAGGASLATFLLTKSWLIYTLSDYFWDVNRSHSENNLENNIDFNAGSNFQTTTNKFLTYQSINTAIRFVAIYALSGSTEAVFLYGGASTAVNSGLFFLNNYAWDLYESSFTQIASPVAPLQLP